MDIMKQNPSIFLEVFPNILFPFDHLQIFFWCMTKDVCASL
jgi:hypothetical protein